MKANRTLSRDIFRGKHIFDIWFHLFVSAAIFATIATFLSSVLENQVQILLISTLGSLPVLLRPYLSYQNRIEPSKSRTQDAQIHYIRVIYGLEPLGPVVQNSSKIGNEFLRRLLIRFVISLTAALHMVTIIVVMLWAFVWRIAESFAENVLGHEPRHQ